MRTCRKRKRKRVCDWNVFKDVVDFIEEILGWVSESSGKDSAFLEKPSFSNEYLPILAFSAVVSIPQGGETPSPIRVMRTLRAAALAQGMPVFGTVESRQKTESTPPSPLGGISGVEAIDERLLTGQRGAQKNGERAKYARQINLTQSIVID
jgi:hypothetical protein